MATQFKTLALIAPQQPRLPAAPVEYNTKYQEDYSNILRLYFNQLQNFNQIFTTSTGGSFLQFPNGAFHQDGATALTGAMTNVSTTAIQVTSTAAFPSAGHLLIAEELVAYTGKTTTTFTGITRGVYGSTNVAHAIGVNVTEALGVASSTSSKAIPFTNTDYSNGIALNAVDASHIDVNVSGRYNIQFSAQILNLDSSEDAVTIWFSKDGTAVANSAGLLTIPKKTGAGPGAVIATWNIVLDIYAGSYFELLFASKTGNSVIATFPAGTAPVTPVSPSVILTVTFVSALFT